MRTGIARWGNSLAVRLPRALADQAGIAEGTAVEIDVEDGHLVIRPARPRYALDDLLAGRPGGVLRWCYRRAPITSGRRSLSSIR